MSDNQPTTQPTAEPPRVAEFRDEIGQLRLKGAGASSERWMLVVGIVLVVGGVALGIMGAIQTINAGDSPADQRAFTASGVLLGIVLTVAGAALFLRYSLARYLRFWLIRLVYENRVETDRIVDAIERGSGLKDDPGTGSADAAAGRAQNPLG
ncbi:MAG: hypothetical protein H6517_08840 [Microthrixaceae bacterium]|nr:hypothetical protein [Microthrixaceae bacterium]MCB1011264.1 hypothetical protein [Microthrixaceae bacterium]MCB9387917.1 hypothetical protein [Microthrixaceae bacterium]MCO5321830.1 hypothetical protein [Microthrixaceae bacterium]